MSAGNGIVNRDAPTLAAHGDSLATWSIEWQWRALAPFGHHARSAAKSEVKLSTWWCLPFRVRFRNSCRAEEAGEKVVVASRLRPSAAKAEPVFNQLRTA